MVSAWYRAKLAGATGGGGAEHALANSEEASNIRWPIHPICKGAIPSKTTVRRVVDQGPEIKPDSSRRRAEYGFAGRV